jgi:hypothetical protein
MSWLIYNSLPFLDTADNNFLPHREILSDAELILLFKKYHRYGVCLVHRHYDIEIGELVVTDGDTTRPLPQENGSYYPERWLPDGTAYEFNTKRGEDQLDEMFLKKFQEILKKYNGLKSLGIFFIHSGPKPGRVMLEETDVVTRLSTTKEVECGGYPMESIETNWIPGSSVTPLFCICTPHCKPSRVDLERGPRNGTFISLSEA